LQVSTPMYPSTPGIAKFNFTCVHGCHCLH
jgi:hypothetical protein